MNLRSEEEKMDNITKFKKENKPIPRFREFF